jgi:tetratricopeptide (TPR) repeat protein
MIAREFDAAAEVMRLARDQARACDQTKEAALLGMLMASALSVAGRLEVAENAYLEAEADDPRNALLKLQFANFLLDALRLPERALLKVEEVLPELKANRSTYHAAVSSLGVIYASLGRMEDAAQTFRELVRPEALPGSEPRAYDFRLVTALVGHGMMLEECRQYAGAVLALAERQGDDDTVGTVRAIIGSIEGAQSGIP